MIPHVIHYCWFGNKELTPLARKCIASWRKYCPDYAIRQWNESNFDVHACAYASEAYLAKKWAFVSDYARMKILYEEGGVYFDTDVELVAGIHDLVEEGAFMALENDLAGSNGPRRLGINPGLGMAATAGMPIYKKILDSYETEHFILANGAFHQKTIVTRVTKLFLSLDLHTLDARELPTVAGVRLYPVEYFCPLSMDTKQLNITRCTRAIHHFSGSWLSMEEREYRCAVGTLSRTWARVLPWRLADVLARAAVSYRRYGLLAGVEKVIHKMRRRGKDTA